MTGFGQSDHPVARPRPPPAPGLARPAAGVDAVVAATPDPDFYPNRPAVVETRETSSEVPRPAGNMAAGGGGPLDPATRRRADRGCRGAGRNRRLAALAALGRGVPWRISQGTAGRSLAGNPLGAAPPRGPGPDPGR